MLYDTFGLLKKVKKNFSIITSQSRGKKDRLSLRRHLEV